MFKPRSHYCKNRDNIFTQVIFFNPINCATDCESYRAPREVFYAWSTHALVVTSKVDTLSIKAAVIIVLTALINVYAGGSTSTDLTYPKLQSQK